MPFYEIPSRITKTRVSRLKLFYVLLKNLTYSLLFEEKHEQTIAVRWLAIAFQNGGARRDRTDDLLRAKQALSQLSYGPATPHFKGRALVGLGGFEPPTSPLSGVRSNQLSYRPGNLKTPRPGRPFKPCP